MRQKLGVLLPIIIVVNGRGLVTVVSILVKIPDRHT